MSFAAHYLIALAAVALMLFGLQACARVVLAKRLASSSQRRFVSVVESTLLAQNADVHVVKAGSRYYLIGRAAGGLSTLAEIAAAEVESWTAKRC